MAISPIDQAIVLAYLVIVVGLGLWVGGRSRDLAGYLLGGRRLPWWALLGSIVATETSTATFLSVPGIAFARGGDLRLLQLAAGLIVGRIVVALVLLPHFFRGRLYTAYELLQQRFGGETQQVASATFLVARNLGDGLRLLLAAIVLEKVMGLSLPWCIVLIGVATVAYTFFGGMRAVVWNDCVQLVVYLVGGVVALGIVAAAVPGGWAGLHEFAQQHGKLRVLDFRLDWSEPFTFWSGILGGAALTLGTHGTDQLIVQRCLAARTQRDAARALVASGLVVFAQFALFLLLGVALACFYARVQPDTSFERQDEVLATFIVQQMPVGMVGLTLAAVFAAAMSTLSSSLNSSAAAVVNDFWRSWRPETSSADLVRLSRQLTVVFAVVQVGVAIVASRLSRSVVSEALAIAGFTAGLLLGIFFLGVLTRRVNQRGALAGLVAGLVVLLAVHFATPVAWPWYPLIGALTTFGIGYLVSLGSGGFAS